LTVANLPIEEIEKMVGSRYALTVLAGKRARDLRAGAPQLVNSDSSNPILVALQEILEGKVVAENLDLSAGIEERLAVKTAEAALAARAAAALSDQPTAAQTAAALLPLQPTPAPAELLPLPTDDGQEEHPEKAAHFAASSITSDADIDIEEEDLAEADEFTALDGNIDPSAGIDPNED
jgi:DNA-directed RNA polymerase subunit omega